MSRELLTILSTGVFTAAALRAWRYLLDRHNAKRLTEANLVAILVAVGVACRLTFALLTPPFYAPDEQAHFKYVQYLAENRSLPVQTSKTDDATNDWEYFQPPLYYAVLTPLYSAAQPLLGEVGALRTLRMLSVLLWLVTVTFSYRLLDRFQVQNAFARIFVMGLVCLLPTYTFISSMVNSDNLLIALGSVILYVAAAPKQSIRQSLLLGLLMGVALLTKLPAIIYPAVIAFSMLVSILRRKATFSSLFYSALAGLIGGGLMIPWLWRNLQVYGSLTGIDVANTLVVWPSVPLMVYALYNGMQNSFWAVSGIYNQVQVLYPNIGRGVSYVAVIGWVYTFITHREAIRKFAGKLTSLQIGMGVGILLNLGLVIQYGVLYAQGQGRYLYPLLIPIALIMARGLQFLPVARRENIDVHVVGAFMAYVISFAAFSLAIFPRG